MRPEWTEAERGEAAGVAHDAAWSTVMARPAEGWRNSYSAEEHPEMAAAHHAAHQAMEDYPVWEWDREWAHDSAFIALWDWEQAGRLIRGYEAHIPRLSVASVEHPSGADNPRQVP